MKQSLLVALIYLFPLIVAASPGDPDTTMRTITPKESVKLLRSKKVIFLDVRTPEEYAGELGHPKGALLIPLPELEGRLNELKKWKNRKIIVVCRSGNRSGKATRILRANGFDAYNMTGGMIEWNSLNLPTEKDKK